jgi:hypothetical protein
MARRHVEARIEQSQIETAFRAAGRRQQKG